MPTLIHRRVVAARAGVNPYVICRVPSGWVVMGDVQFLTGYCLLLPDPVVPDLNALDATERVAFLSDMTTLGDVLLEVTQAARINYEILGNKEPALHAHLFPRYDDEPEELRQRPAWFYDWASAGSFDATLDAPLMKEIGEALHRRGICQPSSHHFR